jgi:hypothetical protein
MRLMSDRSQDRQPLCGHLNSALAKELSRVVGQDD